MSDLIVPAIMVGGSGTRLWPLSRSNKPKQFLALGGDMSMFQNTVTRVKSAEFARPWFLTNQEFASHIEAQLPDTGVTPAGIILEPFQRGTAAAIAAVARVISNKSADALILVMPADHIIADAELFKDAVLRAAPLAKFGKIVTFGIVPTAPETGYGYIRPSEKIVSNSNTIGFNVDQPGGFLEKPNEVDAKAFIEAGYFWNAGIFLFKASTMLHEFEKYAADTLHAVTNAVASAKVSSNLGVNHLHLCETGFAAAPANIPVDTAIMEKSHVVAVVPCKSIGWHDVGSLSALWEMAEKDEADNAIIGPGLAHNSKGVLIYSAAGRKIIGSHLEDLLIVDTADALIVIPRQKAQAVKDVVDVLKKTNAPELAITQTLSRSWGEITETSRTKNSVVAAVRLKPETSFERTKIAAVSETWVVSEGSVECFLNGQKSILSRGQSIEVKATQALSLRAQNNISSCVVVCTLDDVALSLGGVFAETEKTQDQTLRVA